MTKVRDVGSKSNKGEQRECEEKKAVENGVGVKGALVHNSFAGEIPRNPREIIRLRRGFPRNARWSGEISSGHLVRLFYAFFMHSLFGPRSHCLWISYMLCKQRLQDDLLPMQICS